MRSHSDNRGNLIGMNIAIESKVGKLSSVSFIVLLMH